MELVNQYINARLKLIDKLSKKGDRYSLIEVHIIDDETGEDILFHSIYVKKQHREVYNYLLSRASE